VPDGLLVIDCDELKSTIVITAQKFAKGTRFGETFWRFWWKLGHENSCDHS
jgi:hypothetical protein